MAIENRNLEVGTKLVAKYKKENYRAEVVEGKEGKVLYKLEDGREFKSPSSAASAVMDGKAANGWRFWSLEEQPAEQKTELKEEITPTPKVSRFKKTPNQKGLPDGSARFYCEACKESFVAPADEQPEHCTSGHLPDGSTAAQEVNQN